VPYAEPRAPYHRKCAFDVSDYGLGFCANSLELGQSSFSGVFEGLCFLGFVV
jgi:Cu2+-containing amine oxidase